MRTSTAVAVQYRLQQWAAQIKDCQKRLAGISVVDWCACNGITKANYYYRLRRVRAACYESFPEELFQQVVSVESELLPQDDRNSGGLQSGLDLGWWLVKSKNNTQLKLAEM